MYIELLIQSQTQNGRCAMGSLAESSPKKEHSLSGFLRGGGHCVQNFLSQRKSVTTIMTIWCNSTTRLALSGPFECTRNSHRHCPSLFSRVYQADRYDRSHFRDKLHRQSLPTSTAAMFGGLGKSSFPLYTCIWCVAASHQERRK